ncbi:MAG: amidase [Thermoanaerobaculia bacterium]
MPTTRRRFLVLTATTAAAAAASAQVPLEQPPEKPPLDPKEPRLRPFDLDEANIGDLQAAMSEGRWSAREIAEMYLRRIDEVDGGLGVNSILEINPDAIRIATERDEERRQGRVRGPLHGVPIVVKDNLDTADRMMTTAGSLALMGHIAKRDSFVVQRLRDAGAILLGKTNLSEWANFRSTHSSSGWSGRGGQTRNPYALDRNPCGSSSGSGAAIAANLAAAAIGTETDGSIVCPSTSNGLVGIKPTVGLVSRAGIVPISHTQDTAGPMARTVADAAAVLSAIAGVDPRDDATSAAKGHLHADYTKFLDKDGLKGARIGVARKVFGFNRGVDGLVENAIDVMRKLGATIVDPADIPTYGEEGEAEWQILLYEFKHDLNAYLAGIPEEFPRTLAGLIAFNETHAREEMPYFGQEIFKLSEEKGPLTEKEYKDALAKARRLTREEGIDAILKKEKVDAIIAPTGSPAWPTDLVNGDHFVGGYSSPSAVSGYPHITVPMGMVFGLPVGLSFFAGAWSEPALIRLAYAYEQATQAREVPRFLATADLSVTEDVTTRVAAAISRSEKHCGF